MLSAESSGHAELWLQKEMASNRHSGVGGGEGGGKLQKGLA